MLSASQRTLNAETEETASYVRPRMSVRLLALMALLNGMGWPLLLRLGGLSLPVSSGVVLTLAISAVSLAVFCCIGNSKA